MYNLLFLPFFIFGFYRICYASSCSDKGSQQENCSESDGCEGKFYISDSIGWQPCDTGYYCSGDGLAHCCPTNYPLSDGGINATSINVCYATQSCELYDGTLSDSCRHYYNGQYSCDNAAAHIEASGCYTNTRKCSLFDGCTGTPNGDATYENSSWKVSGCTCTKDDELYHCNATATYRSTNTPVSNATDAINYNLLDSYYCTRCTEGYYATTTAQQNCDQSSNPYSVCECIETPKGKYLTSCSFEDLPNSCTPTNCPIGQTTEHTRSTDSEDCKYGTATRICDSAGCVFLNDIGGINVSNWIRTTTNP